MLKTRKTNLCLSWVMSLILGQTSFASQLQPQIQEFLTSNRMLTAGSSVLETLSLDKFYSARSYQPVWVQDGRATNMGLNIKNLMQNFSLRHGLEFSDYWTEETEVYFKNLSLANEVGFELVVTRGLLQMAADVSTGRIDPTLLDDDIRFNKKNFLEYNLLSSAINSGVDGLRQTLELLAPQHHYYQSLLPLMEKLNEQKLSGVSYKTVKAPSKDIQLGEKNALVPIIRERMIQHGYNLKGVGDVYDQELSQAVQDLQFENKFTVSSNLKKDSGLWVILSPSLDFRINQVKANLEKLRWLPKQLEGRRIFVNTNSTEIQIFENQAIINQFKTINGRGLRRTPTMRTWVGRVIFNPKWTATDSIVLQDKIPEIQKDIGYLARSNMTVHSKRTGQQVDPYTIDFSNPRAVVREYSFVMGAGPYNALGVYKFPMTTDPSNPRGSNPDDIFMHFTDDPSLFEKSGSRHFSSGCVRLEQAQWMAAYLLRNVPGYDVTSIEALISKGLPWQAIQVDQSVMLPADEIIPVYTIPLTVEITKSGKPRYMKDHYFQDKRIIQAVVNSEVRADRYRRSTGVSGDVNTGLSVLGTAGKGQYFSKAVAVRCLQPQFVVNPKTGLKQIKANCEAPVVFSLNQVQNLPVGDYIVGFENTIYPGFIRISQGEIREINLQKIVIPQAMRERNDIKIFRDFSNTIEQKKIFFERYYLGGNLFKQAIRSYGDFSVGGRTDLDVVRTPDYNYCVENDLKRLTPVSQVREHALYVCHAYTQALSMMDLADLFIFHNNGTFQEAATDYPGDIFPKKNLRYLVSAPLQGADFVSVMPGAYRLWSETSKQEQKQVTAEVYESYVDVNRNFSKFNSTNEIGDGFFMGFQATQNACANARLWRTQDRSYCSSDSQMGCNRSNSYICEEMKLDLRFRK